MHKKEKNIYSYQKHNFFSVRHFSVSYNVVPIFSEWADYGNPLLKFSKKKTIANFSSRLKRQVQVHRYNIWSTILLYCAAFLVLVEFLLSSVLETTLFWTEFLYISYVAPWTFHHSCGSGSVRILINSPDQDPFLSVLGSGSYSNEPHKMNWKGKFNKISLLAGSWPTYWRGKTQVKMYRIKCTVLGTLPLWNSKDPDPHQHGLDPQHCIQIFFQLKCYISL